MNVKQSRKVMAIIRVYFLRVVYCTYTNTILKGCNRGRLVHRVLNITARGKLDAHLFKNRLSPS